MRTGIVAVAALAALLGGHAMAAAQPAVPMLVDVDWLAARLDDRDLVLLHVGDKPGYDTGHIQGARLISDGDLTTQRQYEGGTLAYELPTAADLRTKFASLGVSDSSRVVVYVGSGGILQAATRIILTLDHLGLGDRASLLNGGLDAWTGAGHAPSTTAATIVPGTLSPRLPRPIVVEADFVRSIAQRPRHRLVDARAAVFYQGIQQEGHIPGAINIPFTEVTDTRQMIDPERLTKLFRTAGIDPGDTIVAYCHIGQQATLVIFAARLLGHPVLLYDGSFTDWSRNKRGPIVKQQR